jgi:hypothetical protein
MSNGHAEALAIRRGGGEGCIDQCPSLVLAATDGRQRERAERWRWATDCRAHRPNLLDHRRRRLQLAGEDVHDSGGVERQWESAECAGSPGDHDMTGGNLLPTLKVPEIGCDDARQHEPTQRLPDRHILITDRRECSLDHRCWRAEAFRETYGERIEEHVRRIRNWWRRRFARRRSHLAPAGPAGQITSEDHSGDCFQVGLASERHVDLLESSCGGEQQWRSLQPAALRERDLGAQAVDPCARERISRPVLCNVHEGGRRFEGAGLQVRFCRFQRAMGASWGVGRQRRRALEECGHRGDAAARPCSIRRPFQLKRDILVCPGRGLGPVPCAPIRIDVGIDRLRQRAMRLLSVEKRCRPVRCGAHERMAESHPASELDQLRGVGVGDGGVDVDTEPTGRASQ